MDNELNYKLTKGLIFILAVACGGIVANLYYSQTLVVLIANYLNLNIELAGLIVMVTQIGYCIGLLFIVPLADIIENKKLIIMLLCLLSFCLFSVISTHSEIIVFIQFFNWSNSSFSSNYYPIGCSFYTFRNSW